ncbi:MAG: MG2 domain-containing protein [Saprospiraceae bacterium]
MNTLIWLMSLVLGITTTTNGSLPPFDYDKAWKKVEEFRSQGLPKSALEQVENILTMATREEVDVQIIKAIKTKSELLLETEEEAMEKAIEWMDTQRMIYTEPVKNILSSFLAEMYAQYFQNNRYEISQVSQTIGEFSNDFKTWSSQDFHRQIFSLYQSSLIGKNLDKKTNEFTELLASKENVDISIRPTLYTLLWDRFYQYLSEQTGQVNLSLESEFIIKDPALLGNLSSFVGVLLTNENIEDPTYFIVRGYQKVLQNASQQGDKVKADYDLARLKYVYQQSQIPQKDSLYEEQLQQMLTTYQKEAFVTMMYHSLAEYLLSQNLKVRALEICEQGIKLFPDSPGANACKNTKENILKKEATLVTEKVYSPSETIRFALDYKNLNKVNFKVYSLSSVERVWLHFDQKQAYEKLKAQAKVVYEKEWNLPQASDYTTQLIEGELPLLPLGTYMLEMNTKEGHMTIPLLQYTLFHVSDLSYFGFKDNDNMVYRVVDRMTGKPVKGAKVALFQIDYDNKTRYEKSKNVGEKLTDKKGIVTYPLPQNKQIQIVVSKGKDILNLGHDLYYSKDYDRQDVYKFAEIYTDRAIYRPGQIVHFKTLAIESDGRGKVNVLENIPLKISLYDANYQVVSSLALTTNDFGSVAGSFTIPTGLLTGQYYIQVESKNGVSGQKYFRVEEYKRPTFEVVLDTFKNSYTLHQSIRVGGQVKNFAGNPVDGAKVNFKVIRGTRFIDWGWWWRPIPGYNRTETVVGFGSLVSSQDGTFEFDFLAIPDEKIEAIDMPVFDFRIEVNAVDVTGETRDKETVISVGYHSLLLENTFPNKADIQNLLPFTVTCTNLQGYAQDCSGNLVIEKLKEPKQLAKLKYWTQQDRDLFSPQMNYSEPKPPLEMVNRFDTWEVEKQTFMGAFQSGQAISSSMFEEAGVFKMTLSTKDDFGKNVEKVSYHIMTNKDKKDCPKTNPLHVDYIQSSLEPGQKAEFDFGTSEKPVYMYLIVEKEGKILFQDNFKVSSAFHFSFPIEEAHRGGLFFHVEYVYQNRQSNEIYRIDVPYTNKQLDIKLETFRDRIYPGTQETYSMVVTGQKKDAVIAELMTTMYDASLETFVENQWKHQFYQANYSRLVKYIQGFQSVYNYVVNHEWNQVLSEGNIYYNYPSLLGMQMYYYGGSVFYQNRMDRGEVIMESRAGRNKEMANAPTPFSMEENQDEIYSDGGDNSSLGKKESPPAIRKNLAESVFFYPQFKTDENGNVKFSFTMNEALTKWKMMTIAHTPDMKVGYDERYLQTYKKLMVFPNAPRFLRTSDQLVLTAKVVNTTSENLLTTVTMKLENVLTGEDVTEKFLGTKRSKELILKANSSSGLEWNVLVPEDFTGTLAWMVVGQTDGHSDGEENIIPVLTNKLLVTETLPMYVHGQQKKDFTFTSFLQNNSKTKLDNRYTLEYASHPIWFAVQALPYLTEQGYECTEHIINRYFANQISSKIASSNPRISQIFDQWRLVEKDALLSKLSTNEALKSALIEETPWVMNALSEEEQKRNIALLFEVNTLKNELSKTFHKLEERQLPNGAFPWFINGRADLYMTQYIVESLGQMVKMGALDQNDEKVMTLVQKAMKYIDEETLYWYNKTREGLKTQENIQNLPIHYLGFHYLYIRSFFPEIKLPESNKEVFHYYFKRAKEDWLNQNLYTQILIGIVLQRSGDVQAKKLLQSFEERSFMKDEMGKYWNAGNGYRWNELPIERHSRMIEFYHEMAASTEAIQQMKLWLLKNKQTKHWPTTQSTAAALYGILLEGETTSGISWLEEKEPVKILLDGKEVTFEKRQSGTGYVQKSWERKEFPKTWANISIDNPNTSTSWGALYYQYFEDMDKIKATIGNPLSIQKSVYVSRTTNKGEVLEEISKNVTLHPGDKVVIRLRITTDRAMDYVHLKDSRASGFEPLSTLSGHKYSGGLGYYENIKDLATHFYISHLPKGDFILEYPLNVVHKGKYTGGLATLQSMYAPEFSSHSKGLNISVK